MNLWTSTSAFEERHLVFLITGCDSGFGKEMAITLAGKGHSVYSGCLTPQGVKDLNDVGCKHLIPVILDVTSEHDVAQVMKQIQHTHHSLFCLINNAGIVSGFFTEWASMDQIAETMNVNYLGTVRLCKAALPLLRAWGPYSRILNLSSIAAYLPTPGQGAYAASKAAIKAFSDTLRIELAPFKISVITAMPGGFKTRMQMQSEAIQRDYDNAPKNVQEVYGTKFVAKYLDFWSSTTKHMQDPQVAVDCLVDAVLEQDPPADLPVGMDASVIWNSIPLFPSFLKKYIGFFADSVNWKTPEPQEEGDILDTILSI
ncbi:Retinol dehydrogenase 5 [Kappamyces sp. JEL0829]|nr:Retinol dehydrogenase 5 [Kappamyces sp. JEL0829]